MNGLNKLTRIISSIGVMLILTGCSVGYDNKGPYPYSHVNQKPTPTKTAPTPPRPQQPQIAKNAPSPVPSPRLKPSAPRATAAPLKPSIVVRKTTRITIGRGDTVYAISRKNGVSVRSIIDQNKLRPPYLLKPGQTLTIPVGTNYTVKKGDTVYGVSRRNGILMNELVRLNGLKQPFALSVGQSLKLPVRRVGATTKVAIAPTPQISGKGFMWPVNGRVISNYGPKQAGFHNDGVNIGAPLGSSVYASESGVVVHADNKLKGYGNLILIRHQNGWVTAYAHNDKMLVRKGQQVARGQVVGQVGRSGRVTSPQLHFEMRKGSRAVNPTLYLKS